jgi:uncharacterized protein (UPF0147 family)
MIKRAGFDRVSRENKDSTAEFGSGREQVENRSHEIVKQLNRLANDRSLPMHARNKINQALQHIKELQLKLETARKVREVS